MSLTPHEANVLSYTPGDTTLPRPVGYEANLGVMEESAALDHEHPVFVERWHYVEDTELLNGWNNASGTVQTFRFLRDPMGFVHLDGKLDAGVVTNGTFIYVLPVGYRPGFNHRFPVITSTGAAISAILINLDGTISLSGPPATTNLYFSGIIFEADRNTLDSFIL